MLRTLLDSTNLSPIRQPYEQVADRLVVEITTNGLQPGARLPPERELAARFGVSRSAIREALGSLAIRGIVVTKPQAGTFVAEDAAVRALADDEVTAGLALPADAGPAAVVETRLLIEPAIARLAAERATGEPDPETERLLTLMTEHTDPGRPADRQVWSDADRRFHRQIAIRTGNPVLIAIADHLATLMDQPLWRRLRDESIAVPGRTTLQLAEHRLIAAAVDEADPVAAEQHARGHILRARRYMNLD